MEFEEVCRAYYIAVKLSPELPDTRLMALLPELERNLIRSAKHGVGSGLVPIEQAKQALETGYIEGIDPTVQEFKAIMCRAIRACITRMADDDQDIDFTFDLDKRLTRYYFSENADVPTDYMDFADAGKGTAIQRIISGFTPLDELLSTRKDVGIVPGIVTFIAGQGVGKTYITQAIANTWEGAVWFFDIENGRSRIEMRQMTMTGKTEGKRYYFGPYDVEHIYNLAQDQQPDNLLVVLDSIKSAFGNGQGPNDYQRYIDGYKYADMLIMNGLAKLVIMSTHYKQGTDGSSAGHAGASATIGDKSSAVITINNLGALPGDCTEYEFKAVKDRDGDKSGKHLTFSFHHETGTVGKILTGGRL